MESNRKDDISAGFQASESASYLFSIAFQQDRNTNIATPYSQRIVSSGYQTIPIICICRLFLATLIHATRKPGEALDSPWTTATHRYSAKSTFYKGNIDNVRHSTTVPYIYHNNPRRPSPKGLLTDNIIAAHIKMRYFLLLSLLSEKTDSVKHSHIALFLPD